ncbi:MAG: zinc-ribbon domain-containing protein [Anaerolineae bacterium]|jgi:predicted amidophosphoribosyltransferase|nr:zinc-ribbon domain-containing protein [Chloroflexota bacterium]
MRCQNCGSQVQPDALFCDQCGAKLEAAPPSAAVTAAPAAMQTPVAPASIPALPGVAVCAACGAENLPGEAFCSDCGSPLAPPEPMPEAAPFSAAAPEQPVVVEAPLPPEAMPASEPPAPVATPAREESAPVAAAQPEQTIACAACGAELEAGDRFCHACGARVQAPAAAVEPPAAVEAVEAAAPASPAPAVLTECPTCGAHVTPGELFCEFCGAALVKHAATPAQQSTSSAPVAAPAAATLSVAAPATVEEGPALQVVETGQLLLLPVGTEVLVGREDSFSNIYPDIDLTPFGAEEKGVSRRHFKLTVAENAYVVLDLGSTNYTWVNQQRLQPNVPVRLQDGDEIRAGRLKLVFKARG